MATSQDKAQKFKEAFRGKGPQIIMGVMALLLAARIFFFLQENSSTPPPPAAPTPITTLPSAIKPETEVSVSKMLDPLPDFTTTTYYALARVNMFDAKAAQNADSVINRANQFVVQAQGAFDRGNLPEAIMMLKEALLVNPSQSNALALRAKIMAHLQAAATSATLAAGGVPPALPGATPAPAVPGATPIPGATPAP